MATVKKLKILKAERLVLRGKLRELCNLPPSCNLLPSVKDKGERLFQCDAKLLDALVEDEDFDTSIALLEEEIAVCEEYRDEYQRFVTACERDQQPQPLARTVKQEVYENVPQSSVRSSTLRLPRLTLTKFSGNVRDWIGWFGQFKKIHDSDEAEEDKFQLLLQATEGPAHQLVLSYPPMAENYSKAFDALKSSFAKDHLIIEAYVQDLLFLVRQQNCHCSGNQVLSLDVLVNELEAKVRALETMGLTKDRYAMLLYPLIRSSLPDNLVTIWQRQQRQSFSYRNVSDLYDLEGLLSFLRNEVDDERMRQISKPVASVNLEDKVVMPTVSFVNTSINDREKECIFCNDLHLPQNCRKALQMPFDKKKAIIMEAKRCLRCFKSFHYVRQCRNRSIKCDLCSGSHYKVMCLSEPGSPGQTSPLPTSNFSKKEDDKVTKVVSNSVTKDGNVYLLTLRVNVTDARGNTQIVRAMIDPGSQRSYVKDSLVTGVPRKGYENIQQSLFGGVVLAPVSRNIYDLQIEGLTNDFSINIAALEASDICSDVPQFNDRFVLDSLKKEGIDFTDTGETDIKLLLGADVFGKLLTHRSVELPCGLSAMETRLGWTISGRVGNSTKVHCMVNLCLQDLWTLEAIGINDPATVKQKAELDKETLLFFESTIRKVGNSYEVALPWLEGHPPLPSNYDVALKRLGIMSAKLERDGLIETYDKVLKEWEDEGFIQVTNSSDNGNTHYLPHRAVFKEGTTKVRPVFDASCKRPGHPSLNECLSVGPNMLEYLPLILTKFRVGEIGVIGDIKKAFLMIQLREEDRSFLKFLWWSDFEKRTIKTYQHCVVPFGVGASPFLLNATLKYHLKKEIEKHVPEMQTAVKLLKSYYADDCVSTVNDMNELKQFINESETLMKRGGFELSRWFYSYMPSCNSGSIVTEVLGLKWNTETDELFCKSVDFVESGFLTKRKLLSVANRLFDPLGICTPVALVPKILLQDAWKIKVGWDEGLPENICKQFVKWQSDLELIKTLKFNRKLSLGDSRLTSLHVFCDASISGYGAVIFLRSVIDDNVLVQFVIAKGRVAPIVRTTIPRLELISCCIGSRLLETVKDVFPGVVVIFWSDSQVALSWIKLKEPWKNFVGNRVDEIRNVTEISQWRHVPGNLNPADVISRGCNVNDLIKTEWWKGPAWLYNSPECWPCDAILPDPEAMLEKRVTVVSMACIDQLMNNKLFYYFSKFTKTVRMIAWMFRFCFNASHSVKKREPLTAEEVIEAERRLLIYVQGITDVQNVKELKMFKHKDGLIRVKSRLTQTHEFEPIVLKSDHVIVTRLITETHLLMNHASVDTLLSKLREKYWIIRGRRVIRSVVRACTRCRRLRAAPGRVVEPPLPIERTDINVSCFQNSGVDYAGPLLLQNDTKVWIALFTCAVYRAVHLEVVPSLSTESFLMALRRFIARRGQVSVIFSDNASCFTRAGGLMKDITGDEIEQFAIVHRIKWKHITPAAPWQGGFWERMVGMMKEVLARNAGLARLSLEELQTVLTECESTMNMRPLTYVADASDPDSLQPITPAHFCQDLEGAAFNEIDFLDSVSLNRRLQYVQKVRMQLKERLQTEYLNLLIYNNSSKHHTLKEGDIVIVHVDGAKRLTWPLGKVEKLCVGKDGLVRSAEVKVKNGSLLRPVQKLYPLECYVKGSEGDGNERSLNLDNSRVDEPDTSDGEDTSDQVQGDDKVANLTQVTRVGRKVRQPKRLDL